ncbi:MAG: c-type cytochrome [Chitinophagaceae bacterium]|jgi:cytochrome c|nr:c-type cytochrome [Chitinophagaceae bacterium]
MKKIPIIFSCFLFLISCGGDDSTKTETGTDTVATAPAEPAPDPEIAKGLDLVAKSDCFTCHKLTEKAIGPAYADIAAKYMGNQIAIDSLPGKIIKGGAGIWGTVPMTPHPTVSPEDAKAMVTYVMSIKK